MSDTNSATCLQFSPASANSLSLEPRRFVYSRLRQMTAMAAGLGAIAQQALDEGDATPEQIEHFANLADHLTQQLNELTRHFMELTGGQS